MVIYTFMMPSTHEDNSLHSQLTPRVIRQMVEKEMDLEQGTLDAKKYKDAARSAVTEAMASIVTSLMKCLFTHSCRSRLT